MDWMTFRNQFIELGCFSIHQVYAWQPNFDRNNLGRWIRKGYLSRLRRGWYAFPEYKKVPGMSEYFAGRIYKPSYISLHTALSFYGLIPESVVQITSVTTLKTAVFKNDFGEYSYKSLKRDLIFGYCQRPVAGSKTMPFASCEKALLDLLYLYPFYDSQSQIVELRLDRDAMRENLDVSQWEQLGARFQSKALDRRMHLLTKVYGL